MTDAELLARAEELQAEARDFLVTQAEGVKRRMGGLAESPGWNVFKLEDGVIYHTYSRMAPDRFLLTPFYFQLLDQVPNGRDRDFPLRRHDEY